MESVNSLEEEVVEGRAPTAWETFYFEWGQETLKKNLATQNDFLKHATTLNAALIGGGVALSGQQLIPPGFLVAALACFLVALGAALGGLRPYNGRGVDLCCPEEIRAHKAKATAWKTRFADATTAAMLTGFGLAILGLLLRVVGWL